MSKLKEIFITSVLVILFLSVLMVNALIASKYTTEEYIVQAGDTFWGIYLDRYSEEISYQEALYNFKKDNQMDKYELYEGQTVILRKY
jgi:hypothetical protein